MARRPGGFAIVTNSLLFPVSEDYGERPYFTSVMVTQGAATNGGSHFFGSKFSDMPHNDASRLKHALIRPPILEAYVAEDRPEVESSHGERGSSDVTQVDSHAQDHPGLLRIYEWNAHARVPF